MEPDLQVDAPKKRGRKAGPLPYCQLCKRHLHKCTHGKREEDNEIQQGTATRSQSNAEILELQKKRKAEEGKLGHAKRKLKKLKHAKQSDKRRQVLDTLQGADEAIKQVRFKHCISCVACSQTARTPQLCTTSPKIQNVQRSMSSIRMIAASSALSIATRST